MGSSSLFMQLRNLKIVHNDSVWCPSYQYVLEALVYVSEWVTLVIQEPFSMPILAIPLTAALPVLLNLASESSDP